MCVRPRVCSGRAAKVLQCCRSDLRRPLLRRKMGDLSNRWMWPQVCHMPPRWHEWVRNTMWYRYNAINFLQNIRKRHPIARPSLQFLQWCEKYHVILSRVITALDCMSNKTHCGAVIARSTFFKVLTTGIHGSSVRGRDRVPFVDVNTDLSFS